MTPRRRFAVLLGLAALTAMGCESRKASVSGTVRFNGNLVTSGSISFFGENGEVASTLIAADGSYHVRRLSAGPVRVTVVSHPPVPASVTANPSSHVFAAPYAHPNHDGSRRYWALPDKFRHPDRSGLAFVLSSGEQVLDIDLTP
jgi:hypothetical protein